MVARPLEFLCTRLLFGGVCFPFMVDEFSLVRHRKRVVPRDARNTQLLRSQESDYRSPNIFGDAGTSGGRWLQNRRRGR